MRTWTINEDSENIPLYLKNFLNRKQVHKKVFSFNEILFCNQYFFIQIKKIINKVSLSIRITIFGSRVNGDFTKKSDFDILVWGANETEKNEIMNSTKNLAKKVDILFIDKLEVNCGILIPD